MTDANRVRRGEAPVRFDQNLEIGAERIAHRPDVIDGEILVPAVDKGAPWARERIEFGSGEAHCLDLQSALDTLLDRRPARPTIGVDAYPLARSAADQVVDRKPRALTENVPGCDLDRTPRRGQLRRAALDRKILEHDLAGMANVKDAAADQVRRHRPDDLGDDGLLAVRDVGFAPAMEPVLGLDATEQQILRTAGA